jgi:hypothetical protein
MVTRQNFATKVVDTNSFGLLQLVDFIAEHCLWVLNSTLPCGVI